VEEMPAGCASSSCVTTLGGGFFQPYGVAVDGSGNVYVADTYNSAVKEMPAGCASSSCVTTLGGGFFDPEGVAVDGSGNVYVADYGHSAVKEINRATPPSLSFAATAVGSTSSDSPRTVTIANNGNQPLTFSAVSFPVDFPESGTATGDCTASTTLPANGSCTLTIDFAPITTLGSLSSIAHSESVTITTNTLNTTATTQAISVTGTEARFTQTISFTPIAGTQYALTQLPLVATASSGLAVAFSSTTPTICAASGSTLSLLTAGTCVVRASQAGNADYSAAPATAQSFAVHLAPQTITFTPITGTQYALASAPLTATASSGLGVAFSSTTPTICSVSGSRLSLLIPGTCVVHAAQAGNSVYASATTAQSFAVSLDPQTITFTPVTGTQYAGAQQTLAATATSGLTVTFSSTTTSICSVSGSTLSLLKAGTCIVHATQAGNSAYAEAPPQGQSFAVALVPQTITFTPITGTRHARTRLTLAATASSNLTVTFSSTTTTVCSVSGDTLSLRTPGNCVVHASQAGNGIYASATTAQSFAVKAAL